MYSNYTPLQYIEPATITTVPTPTVVQTPQPMANVSYNSPPKCVLTPKTPVMATSTNSPVMQTPNNSPVIATTNSFVIPTRGKTETMNVGVLDDGWSDTNEIRVNENVNSVTFEFVESTINLKTRSNTIKKSDEIVKFYETPEEAKNVISFLIQKLAGIPNVIYDVKPRTSDDPYARLLINYVTDNADGFFTFNGYITIYSESDDTLDKITHLLEAELQRLSAPQPTLIQNTVVRTPVQSAVVTSNLTPVQIRTPVQSTVVTPNSSPFQPAVIQTSPVVPVTPNNTPLQAVNYNTKFSPRAYLSDYQ